MAITLEQASQNAQSKYEAAVIDSFRRASPLMDMLPFVQSATADTGNTPAYTYRRIKELRGAAFRKFNEQYTQANATTEQHTVNLRVMGGKYSIDRAFEKIGTAQINEVAFQTDQLVKATNLAFADALINADKAGHDEAFDGLSVMLKDSAMEFNKDGSENIDWTAFDAADKPHKLLDELDRFTFEMDDAPTALLCNRDAMRKIVAAARRASMYVEKPTVWTGTGGQPGTMIYVGNTLLVDPGLKPGTNNPIIPTATDGTTDIYAVRIGTDGFHGVTMVGSNLIKAIRPDFEQAVEQATGLVELGPAAVVLKSERAAAVLRKVKVKAAS